MELTKIPITILEKYQEVELVGDVMRVNKLRFFLSMSCHIKFITSEHIENSKEDTLFSCIKKSSGYTNVEDLMSRQSF